MSGYFRRLAQRTGLVAPALNRAGARRQAASSGSSLGLEQEPIVEAPQPSSAPAAAHEHSRNEGKASAREADRAMPTPARRAQTAQSRTSLREPHSVPTAVAAALPAARDAAMPVHEPVELASPVEEHEELSASVIATTVTPRGLDTESIASTAGQPQPAPSPLEHSEQRLDAPTPADARAGPVRDRPLQTHVEISAPLRAQPDRVSIELEARTSLPPRFVTELLGRPVIAQSPTLRAPTVIDVRIGTVAVEIHQAAPPPVAPSPTPVLALAPRPAAPRERFSPSRHYIRMD